MRRVAALPSKLASHISLPFPDRWVWKTTRLPSCDRYGLASEELVDAIGVGPTLPSNFQMSPSLLLRTKARAWLEREIAG